MVDMNQLTSEQIIRNINLYLLSDIELEESFLSIYNDLERIFSDLNIYKSKLTEFSDNIYYGKSKNDLYIEYNETSEWIYLDDDSIWSVFEDKYDLSYECIQGITTWYVVNTLHLKGTTEQDVLYEDII